jgi:hypothetical protein
VEGNSTATKHSWTPSRAGKIERDESEYYASSSSDDSGAREPPGETRHVDASVAPLSAATVTTMSRKTAKAEMKARARLMRNSRRRERTSTLGANDSILGGRISRPVAESFTIGRHSSSKTGRVTYHAYRRDS